MAQSSFNHYDVGDLVRCSAAFNTSAGTAVDPTAVVFKVKNPAGTVTTYTYLTDAQLVKDSTGRYHVDVSVTAAGWWFYRFNGTGTNQSADEVAFIGEASAFS